MCKKQNRINNFKIEFHLMDLYNGLIHKGPRPMGFFILQGVEGSSCTVEMKEDKLEWKIFL